MPLDRIVVVSFGRGPLNLRFDDEKGEDRVVKMNGEMII